VAVTPCADADGVRAALASKLTGDEVILLLSSGPLDGLADSLPPWLEARFPEAPARAANHG
jgi:UDP-N-acetylmuramate: L-alanyl-gamma-D-glutamyl-meso-diaminopimelate ligase